MSVYMTEEEQLEAIKNWWKRYNSIIILGLSLVLMLVAGFKYWHWHQEKITRQASNAYEHLMVAFSNKDTTNVSAYSNQLINQYGNTVYADIAHMTLAKQMVGDNQLDKAEAHLQYVAQTSKMPALQQVAKIRLARILISKKQYDKALNEINSIADASYEPLVNELRGDIFAATGEYSKAVASYQKAVNEAQAQGIGNIFLEMKTNEFAAFAHSIQPDDKARQVV